MSDGKASLARDGTMQVTAKEGIALLEAAGHDKLLKLQGLKADEEASGSDKPALPRDSTMAVTAKEGEQFLEASGGSVDADALTRGQQKKIEELQSETAEAPSPKKPRIPKDGTMAVTAKEGKDLLNNEKLGDTRQETAKAKKGRSSVKREGTMAKTMQEAKTLLEGDDMSGGRKTRSSSRVAAAPAKPPVKRAGTMQKTAKDGKEFLNRSKKAKKEEDVAEEEEEKEEEDEKAE